MLLLQKELEHATGHTALMEKELLALRLSENASQHHSEQQASRKLAGCWLAECWSRSPRTKRNCQSKARHSGPRAQRVMSHRSRSSS